MMMIRQVVCRRMILSRVLLSSLLLLLCKLSLFNNNNNNNIFVIAATKDIILNDNRILQQDTNDFNILNDRWSKTLEIQFDNITQTTSVIGIPLNVNIVNTVCNQFTIQNISWTYDADNINNLYSNLTVDDFSIYCLIDYNWNYLLFGTSGQAEIYISQSDIETSFILTLPNEVVVEDDEETATTSGSSNNNTSNSYYQFNFNECISNVNVNEFNFLGTSPIDTVLKLIEGLLQGTITNLIENQMCTLINTLDDGFQSLLNSYTNILYNNTSTTQQQSNTGSNSNNINNNKNPLVSYEDMMNISNNISLIDFYQTFNGDNTSSSSSSSIVQIMNLVSQFSGISIFVDDGIDDTSAATNTNDSNSSMQSNNNNTSNKLFDLLLQDYKTNDGGYVFPLSNNTLLNGNRSLLHSFVVRNTTTTTSNSTSPDNSNSTTSSSIFDLIQLSDEYMINYNDNDINTEPGILNVFFGIEDIIVTNASIYGLQDALRSFNGIQILSNYTIGIDLTLLNDMKFIINTEIQRNNMMNNDTTTSMDSTTSTTEMIQIGFNTSQVQFKTGILIAIIEDIIGTIKLGSLLYDIPTILLCISSTLYEPIQMTGFDLISFDIHTIYFDGLQTIGMERLMNTIFLYAIDAIRPTIDTIISKYLIGYDIIKLLSLDNNNNNETNTTITDGTSSYTCPDPVKGTTNEYIDFRDLLLPNTLAKEYGGSGTEPYGNLISNIINEIIPSLLDYTNFTLSGVLLNYTTNFRLGKKASSEGIFIFNLNDFRFENEGILLNNNNITNNTLLQAVPNEPNIINNTLSLGKTIIGGNVEISYNLGNNDDRTLTRNIFDITINFDTFTALITILAKAIENQFLYFPLEDIFNINCWLSIFPPPKLNNDGINMLSNETSLSITDFNLTMDGVFLNVSCLDCTPALKAAAEVIKSYNFTDDIQQLIQQLIQMIIISNDDNYEQDRPLSILQRELDRMIYDAPKHCPQYPQYNASYQGPNMVERVMNSFIAPESYINSSSNNNDSNIEQSTINLIIGVIVAGTCIVICIVIFLWVNKKIVTRRFKKMVRQLPQDELVLMMNEQLKYSEKQNELNLYSISLYKNEHNIIPSISRYGIPVLLLVSSACFWCGLFLPSMTVKFYFSIITNEASSTYPIFQIDYSLAGFATEWWNTGAKFLSVLCILSILWPQTKLILTAILWFIPTSLITVSKRGSLLKLFDFFSKWSIIVIFIVIISTSIFQGEIVAKFYSFEFVYVPIGGMYAILVGQIVSELASKLVLHYHNRTVESFENEQSNKTKCEQNNQVLQSSSMNQFEEEVDVDEIEPSGTCLAQAAGDNNYINHHRAVEKQEQEASPSNDRYALCYSKFTRPHRGACGKLHIRPVVKYGYTILCLLVIVIVFLGSILPSFSYDISGVLGVALNFGKGQNGEDNSTGTNSVFTIVSSLMESARLLDQGKFYFGLGFIATFLILTVLIIPIMEIVILLIQWLVPMEQGSLLRLQSTLYIMESWQCMEVYFVAVVASAIQVNGISKFFADTYCATLTSLLRSLVYWGFLDESDDQCIIMEATINASSITFVVAVITLFVLKAFAKDALRHRVQEENNQLLILKSNSSETQQGHNANQMDLKVNIDDLRPLPVHFTDRFRWALSSE